MSRNQPFRSRASTTIRITEEPNTPKADPVLTTEVGTTPDFIHHVRRHLMKEAADHPERQWFYFYPTISATTTTQGLEVHDIKFGYQKDRNQWVVISTATSVCEDTIELAWTKTLEHLSTKTSCTGCDQVIHVGAPCVPCGIRKMIATRECFVCKDKKHNFYKLLCGHAFCKDCVKRTKPQRCPLCRAKFNVNDGMKEEEDESCDCCNDYSEDDE